MRFGPGLLGVTLAVLWASQLEAGVPSLRASLECERVARPGRILCELSLSPKTGRLVWSDGLVVQAPLFARPLRSRVVAQLGPSAGSGIAKAKLALVATESGQGTLELLARGVVCQDRPAGEWCAAEAVRVTAPVLVGGESPPSP